MPAIAECLRRSPRGQHLKPPEVDGGQGDSAGGIDATEEVSQRGSHPLNLSALDQLQPGFEKPYIENEGRYCHLYRAAANGDAQSCQRREEDTDMIDKISLVELYGIPEWRH